jgi:hypothetical protein
MFNDVQWRKGVLTLKGSLDEAFTSRDCEFGRKVSGIAEHLGKEDSAGDQSNAIS